MLHQPLTYYTELLAKKCSLNESGWNRGTFLIWLVGCTPQWEELNVFHEQQGKTSESPSQWMSYNHVDATDNNINDWVLKKQKTKTPIDSKKQVIALMNFLPCGPCYIIRDNPLNTHRLVMRLLMFPPLFIPSLTVHLPGDADGN